MKKLCFITSNTGKIKSLQKQFLDNNIDITVEGQDLNIIEPQVDTVQEVSLIKAREAFRLLQCPIIVEDGGFEINALNGFPGVYTKYILDTIGVDGILDLMVKKENRSCRFVSCTTYIDEHGKESQFNRLGGEGTLTKEKSQVDSHMAWSDLWYVFHVPQLNKILSEATEEELLTWWKDKDQKSSITLFVESLKESL